MGRASYNANRMNAAAQALENPLQVAVALRRPPIVLLSGCVGFGEEYTRIGGFRTAT
jgi:hypothetical protein